MFFLLRKVTRQSNHLIFTNECFIVISTTFCVVSYPIRYVAYFVGCPMEVHRFCRAFSLPIYLSAYILTYIRIICNISRTIVHFPHLHYSLIGGIFRMSLTKTLPFSNPYFLPLKWGLSYVITCGMIKKNNIRISQVCGNHKMQLKLIRKGQLLTLQRKNRPHAKSVIHEPLDVSLVRIDYIPF